MKDLHVPEDSFLGGWEKKSDEDKKSTNWRKDLRDKLVQISLERKDLPPYSRSCIQVIDPEETGSIMEAIEDDETLLTDDFFFELIGRSPKFLIYEAFQKRICKWQSILHEETMDEEVRGAARDRLKRIGDVLAFVGSGQKKTHPGAIYFEFEQLIEQLRPVMQEIKGMHLPAKRITFKERIPQLKDYAQFLDLCKSEGSLAKEILCMRHGLSLRKIQSILSEEEKIYARARNVRNKPQ